MEGIVVDVVERGDLADVLRGKRNAPEKSLSMRDGQLPVKLQPGQVGVGYVGREPRPLPCMLIVREEELRELFAWVNTYCPFVTPLSQWCRVLGEGDLRRTKTPERIPAYGNAAGAWAGAMIGEAILRLGGRVEALHVSVAALQSCITFVAARAFGLWGSADMLQATRRYEEARELLGSTPIDPRSGGYEDVWRVLVTLSGDALEKDHSISLSEECKLAAICCGNIQENGFISEKIVQRVIDALGWSREFCNYEKSAAEQRLEIYDQALANIATGGGIERDRPNLLADFMVAYFAAKISGRASAHIQLVEGLLGSQPMSILWFGIISALYQPEVWGAEFSGLARLGVKELEFPTRLDERPRSDVSLEELRTLVGPSERYSTLGFRGALPKVLNVELLTGVAGGIRLIEEDEEFQRDLGAKANEDARRRIRGVVNSLLSATQEAQRAAQALDEVEVRERRAWPSGGSVQATRRDSSRQRGTRKGKDASTRRQYEESKLPFDDED